MLMRLVGSCLRFAGIGALSFGVFPIVVGVGLVAVYPFVQLPVLAPVLAAALFLGPPLAAAIGGWGLCWRAFERRSAWLAGLGFALAFTLWSFMAVLTVIGLQAAVDPARSAMSWGVAMTLSGGIGGLSLRRPPRPGRRRSRSFALAGALAFGFAGTIGGWLGFALVRVQLDLGYRRLMMLGPGLGVVVALTLGGALLGAAVGWSVHTPRPDPGNGILPIPDYSRFQTATHSSGRDWPRKTRIGRQPLTFLFLEPRHAHPPVRFLAGAADPPRLGL